MFAVIFEVQPRKERWDDYLAIARSLKSRLEAVEGFIDNDRFASRRIEGRLLSLSTWRDEKALVRWRTEAIHHAAQEQGRSEIFEDYHLRVGEVIADSAPPAGLAILDQRRDETEIGAAKLVTLTELAPGGATELPRPSGDGLVDQESFESIYTPGKRLLLASWRNAEAASRWRPEGVARHRSIRVIRDYGLTDRREAPQFYPSVAAG